MHWVGAAFLANGAAQFLQKYLHATGLGGHQAAALALMYAAGALMAALLAAVFRGRVRRGELAAGAVVGLCSYGGNFAVLRALGGLPGYTVFPVVVGGTIMLTAAVSWLALGERSNARARWGVALGVAAVALLTVG